jgi:hypothetical protein
MRKPPRPRGKLSPVAVERGAGRGEHAAEPNGDVAGLPFNILDRYYDSDGLGCWRRCCWSRVCSLRCCRSITRSAGTRSRWPGSGCCSGCSPTSGTGPAGSPVRLHRRRCCRPGWRQPSWRCSWRPGVTRSGARSPGRRPARRSASSSYLAGVSVAGVLYFGKGGGANEHVLVRTGLPIAGAIAGGGLAVVTVLGSTGRCGRRRSWRPARCRRRRTA